MGMQLRATELQQQVAKALQQLDIDAANKQLAAYRAAMAEPDFWNDQDEARKVSKAEAKLARQIEPWQQLSEQSSTLVELLSEGDEDSLEADLAEAEQRYESLSFALKLNGKYDNYNAIVTIQSGAGGTDAQDWAEMLERMYLRFVEREDDWNSEMIDRSSGEEAGIKRSSFRVEGDWAYGKLQSEHGVHRLVRLSPFNADSLRQTSFAMVEVVPEIDEPDEIEIDESDLRVDVYRAGGKGGQSVNTTDSAVRITHTPTGIAVAIQNERSQLQNKQTALKVLRSKLAQLQVEQHQDHVDQIKGPDVQAAWGNQIRNYVLHPYKQVKDTRTGEETTDTEAVLDGDIERFIEAYLLSEISNPNSSVS